MILRMFPVSVQSVWKSVHLFCSQQAQTVEMRQFCTNGSAIKVEFSSLIEKLKDEEHTAGCAQV